MFRGRRRLFLSSATVTAGITLLGTGAAVISLAGVEMFTPSSQLAATPHNTFSDPNVIPFEVLGGGVCVVGGIVCIAKGLRIRRSFG